MRVTQTSPALQTVSGFPSDAPLHVASKEDKERLPSMGERIVVFPARNRSLWKLPADSPRVRAHDAWLRRGLPQARALCEALPPGSGLGAACVAGCARRAGAAEFGETPRTEAGRPRDGGSPHPGAPTRPASLHFPPDAGGRHRPPPPRSLHCRGFSKRP